MPGAIVPGASRAVTAVVDGPSGAALGATKGSSVEGVPADALERLARTERIGRIAVRLRMPGTPPPWPVVVYSHGLGGHLDSGRLWTEAWAKLGFLGVHVLHASTSHTIFDATSAEAIHQRVSAALATDHNPERCREVSATLDGLFAKEGDFARHLDARTVVIAGHSYGALTAMALAGRASALPLRDKRITAAIALSPGVHPVSRASSMAAVALPMLCVTGGLDAQVDIGLVPRRVRAGVPLENRLAVYRALPPAHRMLLYLDGADHMSFAGEAPDERHFGRAAGWAAKDEPAHHAAVVKHTQAFLQRVRADAHEGRSGAAAPWRAEREAFPGGWVVVGADIANATGRAPPAGASDPRR